MRTLTEQTAREVSSFLEKVGRADVKVHVLMGGENSEDWMLQPDAEAVLVGTQDMLLSAALNRGYGKGRAAWPRAFGLLQADCLWIMDEVQLMDVGLSTSGQLEAFWRMLPSCPIEGWQDRPRFTWWMSATLQPNWLATPETLPFLDELEAQIVETAPEERNGAAWEAEKRLEVRDLSWDPEGWASAVLEQGSSTTTEATQILVIVNRVAQAIALFDALSKALGSRRALPGVSNDEDGVELHLMHGRFRPMERERWSAELLQGRQEQPRKTSRILVATQVVEAGVDISADRLVTALAPWPSLVQRFGRAARFGGEASVLVLCDELNDDSLAAPYGAKELRSARHALGELDSVSLGSLLDYESTLSADERASLYPYEPTHVLVGREWGELFDTTADLSGNDLDVGRFIRAGEERDVLIFWREIPDAGPSEGWKPERREVCRVGLYLLDGWLRGLAKKGSEKAWVWSFTDGCWRHCRGTSDLFPGAILLVDRDAGGYDAGERGFLGAASKQPVVLTDDSEIDGIVRQQFSEDDRRASGDSASVASGGGAAQTIGVHGQLVADRACLIAERVGLPTRARDLLSLVLRLHDWGKAHPAFSCSYGVEPPRSDLAKAPEGSWVGFQHMYKSEELGHRRSFRHELVSMLALFAWLRQIDPWHPALLGPFGALIEAGALQPELPEETMSPDTSSLAAEIKALDAWELDLVAYLVVAHHGKVRGALVASSADLDFRPQSKAAGQDPIRGVCRGDTVPSIRLADRDGTLIDAPELELDLELAGLGLSGRYGRSWTDRVARLIEVFGGARLGALEAIVRAADIQVSIEGAADPSLDGENLQPRPPSYPTAPASGQAPNELDSLAAGGAR